MPLTKLDADFIALVFGSLVFGHQDIFMDIDLLLPFLHGHLQLVLGVLHLEHGVDLLVDHVCDLLYLQFHYVVSDQRLLLLFYYLVQIHQRHLVLQAQLLLLLLKFKHRYLQFTQFPVHSSQVVINLVTARF